MIRHDSTEARALRGKQKAAIARQIARYCSSGRATIRQLAQVLGYSQQLVFQAAKEYGFVVTNDGMATWVSMPEAAQVIPHTPPEWVQRMRNAPAYRRMLGGVR